MTAAMNGLYGLVCAICLFFLFWAVIEVVARRRGEYPPDEQPEEEDVGDVFSRLTVTGLLLLGPLWGSPSLWLVYYIASGHVIIGFKMDVFLVMLVGAFAALAVSVRTYAAEGLRPLILKPRWRGNRSARRLMYVSLLEVVLGIMGLVLAMAGTL